jgi:hypothetical protein
MADLTRRVFVGSLGLGAGFALGELRTQASDGVFLAGRPPCVQSLPLEEVQVNCGFKERQPGDPVQLAYGNSVRDWLHKEVLNSIGRRGFQGQAARFDVAADVLENLAGTVDPRAIGELWLHVTGSVGGKYRSREYVVEL